jgi:hypothetical protein
MAHNFKLTGDYYVSVDGSDSNNGLTKDTPKRTVQAGLNLITTAGKTLVIGSGVYRENISRFFPNGGTVYIAGDGQVYLEPLTSTGQFYLFPNAGLTVTLYVSDIIFRNYAYLGINYYWGFIPYFNRCTFINLLINAEYASAIFNFTNSLFINIKIQTEVISSNAGSALAGSLTLSMDKCIFVNSSFSLWPVYGANITNTFFLNSLIRVSSTGICNYNNIVSSSIILNAATSVTSGIYQDIFGNYYNLAITTSTGTGTIEDPYGRPLTNGRSFSFTNHRILYPTFNANSISVDPLFNNLESQDFTLQATSPMLGKASNGIDNIGGTKYALRYAATGDAFNTSAVSISNLALSASNWVVSGGTTGEVISAPILISSVPKVLQKITYNGQLEFDKLITPGTAGNRNVPDQEVYDSTVQPPDVAGANPDRLVYYLRYSTQANQPTADAQWDNGGYWTAGTYNTFEWNTKPSIDTAFVGNGAPTFNSAVTATFLNVTWIQLKVKLRNDYA